MTNDQLTSLESSLSGLLASMFSVARKDATVASVAPALANNLEQTAAALGHPVPSSAQGLVNFLVPLAANVPALLLVGKTLVSSLSTTTKK